MRSDYGYYHKPGFLSRGVLFITMILIQGCKLSGERRILTPDLFTQVIRTDPVEMVFTFVEFMHVKGSKSYSKRRCSRFDSCSLSGMLIFK